MPAILPDASALSSTRQNLAFGRSVTSKLIDHDHVGTSRDPLSNSRKKRLAPRCAAVALSQDVEDVAILVHATPNAVQLATDTDEHFIEVPLAVGR
jgi:hypothetical protein